jgi:hypothetical protein
MISTPDDTFRAGKETIVVTRPSGLTDGQRGAAEAR